MTREDDMKTEWECIDLNCTHYDGDRCTLGFCEPDILSIDLDYVEEENNDGLPEE